MLILTIMELLSTIRPTMPSTERLKGISADAGSFTAAAEQLHLTNSAVSKQVARLEARLGTRLFERTTRSLSLTDAGAPTAPNFIHRPLCGLN
ncbi:MAG: LysR family transcriptional regulator [Neisseriaceae bacterium]|nr:LysR family transcriptional regulator [Neisseriaceae bacterium]